MKINHIPKRSPCYGFCEFMFRHEPVNKIREIVIETMGKCRGYIEGRGIYLTQIKDVLDRFLVDYDSATDAQLNKACAEFYSFLHGYCAGKRWGFAKRVPFKAEDCGFAALGDDAK